MDRELIIQKLRQLASSSIFSEETKKTLDAATDFIEKESAKGETAEKEIEGGGSTWFYVCSECHTAINRWDKYCHECGRRLI